jgi:replication factor C subunit 1
MSSGDRGGISSIIQMIKQTKIPIICICNDRHSQSIRTLAGYCYDIKFHKPNKNLIVVKL